MLRKLGLAVVVLLSWGADGCGRTELDSGLDTTYVVAGAAGRAGTTTGSGGMSGASPALTPIQCGSGACTPGKEICCVQRGRRRDGQTCISAGSPCESGVILCASNADCPASAPRCCPSEGSGVCAAAACPVDQEGQQGPEGEGAGAD
jgi:hypothetical protein